MRITNQTIKGMEEITPHNANEVSKIYRQALWVETSGTLKVQYVDGTDYTFPASAVPDNTTLYIEVKKVYDTGTSATGIYGCRLEI
jgi:hypothetical protein